MVERRGTSGRGRIRGNCGGILGIDVSARFGLFEVDSDWRQLLTNGSDVHLTPKAFDLLALIA
jgi:hypothetical protein